VRRSRGEEKQGEGREEKGGGCVSLSTFYFSCFQVLLPSVSGVFTEVGRD